MLKFLAGQPIVGADGSPVYYHSNYPQPHAAHVAYVPNTGHPYMQQQQQQHGQYVPVYYVSGSTTSNAGQPGSQYYMVQQTPSGQVLYIPTQVRVCIYYVKGDHHNNKNMSNFYGASMISSFMQNN